MRELRVSVASPERGATRRRRLDTRPAVVGVVVLALSSAFVAGCGSTTHKNTSPSIPSASPTSVGAPAGSSGTPDLKNVSLALGKGAGAPHVGDTVAYTAVQILKKWGAGATLTLGQGPAVVAGVAGGHLVATAGPLDAEMNGGLVLFGPSQPGQDYQFVAGTQTSGVPALKGKVLAVSSANVGDDVLTSQLLSKYGMTRQSVTIEYSGTEDNSLAAFIAGRVAGFWASSDSVVALKQKNIPFRTLIAARTLSPSEADSYEAASAGWLSSHVAQATAIDLAWLYAAQVFNTNESSWASYAKAYTAGAVPASTIALDYTAYRQGSLFPTSTAAFNPTNVLNNVQQDIASKGITKVSASSPESAYADFGPWNAALAEFQANPNPPS